MQESTALTKQQKEAVGLLSIGTFLEYFDLMLYVHMAVLLNELFFAPADPFTSSLLAAIAFCSTYLFRPFGALVFGYIGDNLGRKFTIVITTFLMSLSCLVMANLPTYEQIGVASAWIVTICRVVQGMSSMGEAVGAQLYIAETIKSSMRHFSVAMVVVAASLGVTASLAIASGATSFGFNWRIAFWFGAGVALIGSIARTNLRETPEFVNAKKRITNIVKQASVETDSLESNAPWQAKVNQKTTLSFFLIECTGPVWFCVTYIYCGTVMKQNFAFTAEQVIHQNFIVSLIELFAAIAVTILARKIHPLRILTIKSIIFSVFVIFSPMLLNNISNYKELFLFQSFIVIFAPTGFPAFAVFCMNFPVFQRFTYTSFTFALSRAIMYAVASFGVVLLTAYFGHVGILIIVIPVICGHAFGIIHFKKLEVLAGRFH